jgi:hypothetical protein
MKALLDYTTGRFRETPDEFLRMIATELYTQHVAEHGQAFCGT